MSIIVNEENNYKFNADIAQLMNIIINNFYSNKDIFIRELISNASDALDKIRIKSLTNNNVLKNDPSLYIQIKVNKKNKTLIIKDSGIGMTKNDLINNLGTIAKSGTKEFVKSMLTNNKENLIGQFGVGFYSAFLVSEKVVVKSKNNNDKEYLWESNSKDIFKIKQQTEKGIIGTWRGTEIILHLKNDQLQYLNDDILKEIILKYSQYISYPILLWSSKKNTWIKINDLQPIWIKNDKNINNDEYNQFYKTITNDIDNPLTYKKFHIEGNITLDGILYIPSNNNENLFQIKRNYNRIKLYVKRVFIKDNCENLLPEYLSFIPGIIDTEDLPLNVSRELLQESKFLNIINKNLIKQCIIMIEKYMENENDYIKFWKIFSNNIKLGIYDDINNRKRLSKLLRYQSTKTDNNKFTSLSQYVKNMKNNQQHIYYITGENRENLINSPYIEELNKRDYEVLLMTDPIDEYVLLHLKEFDNKKLIAITSDNLEFKISDQEKKQNEINIIKFSPLCNKIKQILSDKVFDVKLSNRIIDTPCCITTVKDGWSSTMEKIIKSQALNNNNINTQETKKIFEINPNHQTIISLNDNFINNNNIEQYIHLLYETSLIYAGFSLNNLKEHSNRMFNLVNLGIKNL